MLNFGHTIGHAVETLAGHGRVSHGQAVSIGMVAECAIAVARGMMEQAQSDRVRRLLAKLGLPVSMPRTSAGALWRIMQHDKKNRDGKVRMALPVGLGKAEIVDNVSKCEIGSDEAAGGDIGRSV